jgi:hypothetical protein
VKKKIGLFAFSFLPFFMIGIFSANLLVHNQSTQRVVQAATESKKLQNHQSTFLLIQTDNLNQPIPKLVSINILFLASSDQTFLKVMQIYPSENSGKDALLASQFEIYPGQEINSKFMDLLKSTYDFTWGGFVIFDQQSLDSYSAWLATQVVGIGKPQIGTSSTATIQPVIQTLCNVLQTRSKSAILDFPTSTFSENHWISNITLKSFTDSLNWISPELPLSSCEVISPK